MLAGSVTARAHVVSSVCGRIFIFNCRSLHAQAKQHGLAHRPQRRVHPIWLVRAGLSPPQLSHRALADMFSESGVRGEAPINRSTVRVCSQIILPHPQQ